MLTWGQVNQHLPWSKSQLLKLLQKDPYEASNHRDWSIVLLHLLQVLSSLHSPDPHNIPRYPESASACVISVVEVWCDGQILQLFCCSLENLF